MGDDYEININFVKLVEQYPVLYDPNIDGGPNRSGHQNAWQDIANKLGEDWMTCKEKWKNIRSCYTRYLRNQNSDRPVHRRSYYLSPYMEFLQPFCKSGGNTNSTITQDTLSRTDTSDTEFSQDSSLRIQSVHSEYKDVDENKEELKKQLIIDNEDKEEEEERNVPGHLGRRQWKRNKRKVIYAGEKHTLNHCVVRRTTEDEADLNFLKSLLPEIRSMDNKQKNKFKISVLNVIQNILYSGET